MQSLRSTRGSAHSAPPSTRASRVGLFVAKARSVCVRASATRTSQPHLQLATAKIPRSVCCSYSMQPNLLELFDVRSSTNELSLQRLYHAGIPHEAGWHRMQHVCHCTVNTARHSFIQSFRSGVLLVAKHKTVCLIIPRNTVGPTVCCLCCCSGVDTGRFAESMYQWAATMTQSGRNFPFALPLQADKLATGFQVLEQS